MTKAVQYLCRECQGEINELCEILKNLIAKWNICDYAKYHELT